MLGLIAMFSLLAAIWATIVALVIIYSTWAWGFVLSKCWMWLVVPTFGLVALTWPQAIALGMILSVISTKMHVPTNEIFDYNDDHLTDEEKDRKKKLGWIKTGYFLVIPWATLVITWFVKVVFL